MLKEKRLIVITGPTAVGKTGIAMSIAEHFNTEIISCDSRQLYKEMSIGTAKPSEEELKRIPHHFINHISVETNFTTADYESQCDTLLAQLFQKHTVVVMTGGTGLYIKATLQGLDNFPTVIQNDIQYYEQMLVVDGITSLQNELLQLDPDYYSTVDSQNPRRLIRALSVQKSSGKPYSTFLRKKDKKLPYSVNINVLKRPRPALYKRIESRVDTMMHEGLLAEAKKLIPYKSLPALQTVGYRELFEYFDGSQTYDQAISKIKQHTRNYAKRQLTWFRKMENTQWIDLEVENEQEVINKIIK